MTATRTVRDDQHGTITGYVYGCRCSPCRMARRDYSPTCDPATPETVERVYAALEHEADMDDIVTSSMDRLGELAGVSGMTANWCVHRLADDARVQIVGRVGRGGALEVHLTADAARA